MRRASAPPVVLVLVLSVVLGGAAIAGSPASASDTPAATPPLPKCANVYEDVQTRFDQLSQWRRTSVDTILMVGKRYKPKDLVPVGQAGIEGSGKVRSIVIDDLEAMTRAAKKAGKPIAVRSAYRSYTDQIATFDAWVRASGRAAALKASARPGHSEHQLGTTIDFRSSSSAKAPWDYTDWATTGPGRWMKNNAWKYGWVMSYPKGKFGKTCYQYEPWHYRYVGRPMAERVHDSGLTLREYLWRHYESVP
jgi:D-alanyl-D-alanine carboxypeptidase